jgi:hypothetical protein
MKRTKVFTVALALLVLAACGGSGAADKGQPEDKTGVGRIIAERSADKENRPVTAKGAVDNELRISAVRLSTDNFYASTDLTAEVEVVNPVPDGITFEYRWFIANQEVADATDSTLKGGTFRKHQWILCEARALASDKETPWQRSNFVRAADSLPRIEPNAVAGFSVPGRFSYQITASDADNDELSYELISPLDLGIELDKRSGLLTWDIDATLVQKLGDRVEISFGVSDNDAKPVTGTLTLRFQKNTTAQPL